MLAMAADPATRDEFEVARELLLSARVETMARRDALLGDVAAIVEASESSNADDEHDPEGATIAFERARTDALARQAERGLAEIDAALARIDDGSYGRCSVCDAPIPTERLMARPTARTDVEHA